MDQTLAEIEKRIEVGFVTDDDILHLLAKAKQARRFQDQYEDARGELDELRIKLDDLKVQVTEIEDSVYRVQ